METFGKNPFTPLVYSTRYVLPVDDEEKKKKNYFSALSKFTALMKSSSGDDDDLKRQLMTYLRVWWIRSYQSRQ